MKSTNRRRAFCLGAGMAVVSIAMMWSRPALAQPAAPAAAGQHDGVYLYRGVDRDKRILANARKEGSVVVYTSLASKESMPLAKAFEEKYGVKVVLWRATSDKVVQRAVTEGRARRHAVDVIETNGPEVEMIAREKLLSEFYSPHFADLPPAAFPAHRLWVADRLNFFVVAFNTNKVKRADLPNAYDGFLDARWKGQIGLEATDSEWMAAIIKHWGERGTKFFDQLAAMRPDVRKSHILLAEMVGAGEVPVALTVYNSEVESLKLRGGPVDWKPVEPVIGRPQGIAVARNAPHPNAALLFADYVLSPEGQQLLHSMGRVPVSRKVKTDLNNFPFTMISPAIALDERDKWEPIWENYFIKR